MQEFGKRKDGPGGRRTSPRETVLLPAAMMSLSSSRTVYLVDMSRTGARLRIEQPLIEGQDIWLKISASNIFGTVVWVEEDHCGILFDDVLDGDDAALLQSRGKVVLIPSLSPEEQMAAAEWSAGLAR